MVQGVILAIIGIVASIIITRYYTRLQMAKNQISHFAIKSFDVGKGLREMFPDFQMLYHGKSLAKYARVCQGSFRNTGSKDIHNNEGFGFSLIFPEECVIKAIRVIPSTEDLSINTQIDAKEPNKVYFYINELIRTSEEFKYTVLLESSEYIKNPFGRLSFSNRIPNTRILEAGVKHIKFYRGISSLGFWVSLILILVALVWGKKLLETDAVLLYGLIICIIVVATLSVVAYIKSIVANLNYLD